MNTNIKTHNYSFWGILMAFVFFATIASSQTKDSSSLSKLLKISDKAYSEKKYATAANYYESYLKDSKVSNNNVVMSKLLDCYL